MAQEEGMAFLSKTTQVHPSDCMHDVLVAHLGDADECNAHKKW